MKKVLTAEQTRAVDNYTIENEPINSIDLMERASKSFVKWMVQNIPEEQVYIFCGRGNNGGDGLAIARLLMNEGWPVKTFLVEKKKTKSADCAQNLLRLESLVTVNNIASPDDFPIIAEQSSIIIDALFGSGLSRPLEGLFANLVNHLSQLKSTKISVDIPSGLFADRPTDGTFFKSDYCVSFQLPKLGFLMPSNQINHFTTVNIGLSKGGIDQQNTNYFYIDRSDIQFTKRNKYSHKGTYGHALLIAGSYGKMGAAVLCGKSCLHSGSGLVTLRVPQSGYNVIQTSIPEAMCTVSADEHFHDTLPESIDTYDTIAIGPGLDTRNMTVNMLSRLLTSYAKPLVIDADALNIISAQPELLNNIPKNSILTPHPGEFKRLAGSWKDDFHKLELQKTLSQKHKVIIVLKGANTSISTPEGKIYFNSTGNPGMSTGGSGDVLTGIIAAQLAQGFSSEKAALQSVFVHGLAGDIAAQKKGEISLTASDIIEALPQAFKACTIPQYPMK